MKKLLTLVLAAVLAVTVADGRRTLRGNLKPAPVAAVPADTLAPDSGRTVTVPWDSLKLSFKGYDKPLRATRESFFAVNADSVADVLGFSVTITYYDMSGRMLTRRTERIVEHIPAGETRAVSIPSWDRQRSFYYHLSQRPRSSSAIPYRITLRADSVETSPSSH